MRIGYEIAEAADNHEHLVTLQKNLKIELARLKSPERISKIARSQLGLINPKPKQVVIIP